MRCELPAKLTGIINEWKKEKKERNMSLYKKAGVDVEAGYQSVKLIKEHVKKTFRPEVITDIGGFGGMFALQNKNYKNPILISSTDGVGTKLKLAFLMDKHDTIGIDCVAMCVNDVICCGAEPLFFLDYIATGKNYPEKIAKIVKGMSEGCVQAGCSLIGGETAEMPGMYTGGEYDVAGFAVGIVDKSKIIDGTKIKAGNVLIGLAASGLHSNGFSLIRKLFKISKNNVNVYLDDLGCTLGEELLTPTRIYVKPILNLLGQFQINGIANITGGGFIENIPRMLPEGLGVRIDLGSWPIPPIYRLLCEQEPISQHDLYNTFNMGIGMVLAVDMTVAPDVIRYANRRRYGAHVIGSVTDHAGEMLFEKQGKGRRKR